MTIRPGLARTRRLSRVLRSCAAFAVPAAFLLWSKSAAAQGWMKDRSYQEGAGIRAGDLELHPGIGGEIGYDSNWFLRSHKEGPNLVNGAPANPPREGAMLRITPSFSLSTLGAQRTTQEGVAVATPRVFQFRGTVAATYREFFGAQELRDQRNVSINSGVRADINAGRPIAFAVFAGYQRLIQPSVLSDPNLSFNRSDISGGGEITVMPGGGTLDLRAGYQARAALFEESLGVPFSSITHTISERNRWRFRPRTALFHDTSLQWLTYLHPQRAINFLNDATPVRTRGGLTGLLTEWFGTTLSVGYGATFFQNPAAVYSTQFDSVLAQAEGVFYLNKSGGAGEPGQNTLLLSTITLGYLRDFQQSLLGNFYTSDRGYAKIEYWFGGKAVLDLDGYVERQGYPQPYINAGGTIRPATGANGQPIGDFTNIRAGVGFFGEYRLTDSFGINTTVNYDQTFSDTQIEAGALGGGPGGGAVNAVYDLNWRRFQAFLGARWFL